MKSRVFLVSAVATLGLILWGCGGSSNLKEMPTSEGSNGETTEITVNAGAGTASSASAAVSVAKDISGTAGAESDGEVDAPGEALIVTCGITYGSNLAGDILTPIVALGEDDDYVAACEGAFASKNRCVACRTIQSAPIVDPMMGIIGYSWCKAYCLGMVPSDLEGEIIPMTITFTTQFSIMGAIDPSTVMFRQLGTRDYVEDMGLPPVGHPWVEADLALIDDDTEPNAHYDLTDCDGLDGEMQLTLVDPFVGDGPPDEDFLDPEDPLAARYWMKNFTVADMGNETCTLRTIIETNVPLVGLETPMHMASLLRDPIILDSIWYDEISDLSYGVSGRFKAKSVKVKTVYSKTLADGSDAHFSGLTGQVKIDNDYYSLEINQINSQNIQFMVTTMPPDAERFYSMVDYDSVANAFTVSDIMHAAWQLQGMPFEMVVRNLVTKANLKTNQPVSLRQDEPLVITGQIGCYMVDGFFTDVIEKCYSNPVFTNDRFPADYTVKAAHVAIVTVDPNVDDVMLLTESAFGEGLDTVKLTKESLHPGERFRSELSFKSLADFASLSAGDMIARELRDTVGQTSFVFGVENIAGTNYYFAYTWEEDPEDPGVWIVKSGFKRALSTVTPYINLSISPNMQNETVLTVSYTIQGPNGPLPASCASDGNNCTVYDAAQPDGMALNLIDLGEGILPESSLVFRSDGTNKAASVRIDTEGDYGAYAIDVGGIDIGEVAVPFMMGQMQQWDRH